MENIKGVLAEIKKLCTDISISHKNQCPCYLQNVATLELMCYKRKEEQTKCNKQDEMDVIGKQELRLTYSDLFMKQHKPKQQKLDREIILIEGEAGIGKTILCTSIIDDWASGKQFQEFLIVLLLPLCQPNVASVQSLNELVHELYKFSKEICSSIAKFLKKSTSNILIIADGWDQLSEREKCDGSFLHQLLFGNLLCDSSVTVMITSRPTIGSATPTAVQCIDQLVMVKGFSRATIQSCIESEFRNDPGKIKYLIQQIENNPLIEDLCRVPLNLAMICSLCQTCSEPLPYTMSELYTKLIWNLVQVSMRNSVIKCHYDLSEELERSWWFLCKLAFTSAKKMEATRYNAISHFGILKSVSETQDEVFIRFLHPTIKEYLAAQHLATQHLSHEPLTTQFLEQCAKMAHLSTSFWKFFLSAYVRPSSHFETDIIRQVIHLLSKLSCYSNIDLCHCSFEAKNEVVDHKIIEALSTTDNSGIIRLQSKNAYDCMATIYVIENIKQQTECFVEINLHNCNLTAEQACKLGKILGSKSDYLQIKCLDLSHNGLQDSNIINFFHEAIAALVLVEKLCLSSCGIRTDGISAMVDALTKNLKLLDLSLNPLSTSCLQCLQYHIETGVLVKLEVLLLKGSLPNDISISYVVSFTEILASQCPSIRQLDLSDNNLGEPGNSDLSQVIARLTHLRRDFFLHLNDEYMPEVDDNFVSAMQDSIKKRGTIEHTIAHGIITGPGRSGKDTLMRRLLGEKLDYKSSSTGVLERVVKVEVQKVHTVAAAVNDLKWQRLEYDEEALELMMTTAKYYSVSSTILLKPPSIKYVVKRRSSNVATSSSTLLSDSEQSLNLSVADTKDEHISDTSNNDGDEATNKSVVVYSPDVEPVDILKKALKRRRMDALREHLESSWSLYLTNTGGQTEFQELLPILVCGPSVFFITFPLHFELKEPYIVKYEHPDGNIDTYQSTTTLIEELLQTLATICALDYTCSQSSSDKVPKVFFIGTHKDQLERITAKKTIKNIDEQLQKHIKHTVLFKEDLIQFNTSNQMIFTVNNLSTDDGDFRNIRSAVQKTVESKKHSEQFKVTCPSSWLIFSLILRAKHKSEDRFLSLEKCFEIAQECGISDQGELTQALSFIHSRLGLVRYFNIKGLDEFVIVDPQILFDKITELIVTILAGDYTEKSEIEDFQRGIIPETVVKRISNKCSVGVHLPFTWLTKLLNCLRIAALFTDRNGIKKYFFPSAVCHCAEPSSSQAPPSKSPQVPSLLIGFKSGFCPRGIGGALVKYLMTNEMKSQRPCELHPDKIFKNQVSFGVKAYGSITLKMFPTHLEVYLNSEKDLTDDESRVTCEEAFTQIKNGMKAITSRYIKCHYFFGFYCRHDHNCKVNPHPAKIDWQRKNPLRSKLKCTVEHFESRGLPSGYDMWNIKGKRQADKSLDIEVDSDSDGAPKHLGQIADLMIEWEGRIADELGLTEVDVAKINTQYPSKLKLQSKEALLLWKRKLGSNATYSKLIEVFKCAGYRQYADNVRKIAQCPESDSETGDSSCDEDSYPLPQPQTYPTLKPLSPINLPPPKALPCQLYSFTDPEHLPEGCAEELGSYDITYVPELSLSNINEKKCSKATLPVESLDTPTAKKGDEEDLVLKIIIFEGATANSGSNNQDSPSTPPSAPGKPQATEVTSTHIKLSWTKPEFNGEVMMYAVYFQPATVPTALWERVQTNGPEETIIITDLIKGDSPYIFKVCAIDNAGEGAESEESDEILLTKVSVKDAHHEETLFKEFEDRCIPEEAFQILNENDLSCNLRVLGSQLGLKTSDLDTILNSDQSYHHQLIKILHECNEREHLSWTKIVSVLRKPALKQYRIASRIINMYKINTGSSESDSMQSPRSGSLESSLTFPFSLSEESEPEISEIVNEIADIRDWELLALSLGLTSNDIDMIKQYDHREHRQRLVEMWYERDKDYSWNKLRRELDKLYPQRESSTSVSSMPLEIESPQAVVESQINLFERKFKELNIEVRKEFEEKYKSRCVEILEDKLTTLPRSIAKEHHKLVTSIIKRKHPFTNLRLFFQHLNLYCWNFLEYHVLESLIDSSCSEPLKTKMSEYARDIEGFRQKTTITDFIKCGRPLVKRRSIPPRFKKIVVEHAIDPDVYTLAALDNFRKSILTLLSLPLSECAFMVYRMKHG